MLKRAKRKLRNDNFVMPGHVPGIPVFGMTSNRDGGTSPAMTKFGLMPINYCVAMSAAGPALAAPIAFRSRARR